MASWLVRNTGALIILSSVGAVGGSINHISNKPEPTKTIEKQGEKIESPKEPEIVTKTVQVPRPRHMQEPVKAVRTSGFCRMLSWSVPNHKITDEDECKKRMERRQNRGTARTRTSSNQVATK